MAGEGEGSLQLKSSPAQPMHNVQSCGASLDCALLPAAGQQCSNAVAHRRRLDRYERIRQAAALQARQTALWRLLICGIVLLPCLLTLRAPSLSLGDGTLQGGWRVALQAACLALAAAATVAGAQTAACLLLAWGLRCERGT